MRDGKRRDDLGCARDGEKALVGERSEVGLFYNKMLRLRQREAIKVFYGRAQQQAQKTGSHQASAPRIAAGMVRQRVRKYKRAVK